MATRLSTLAQESWEALIEKTEARNVDIPSIPETWGSDLHVWIAAHKLCQSIQVYILQGEQMGMYTFPPHQANDVQYDGAPGAVPIVRLAVDFQRAHYFTVTSHEAE